MKLIDTDCKGAAIFKAKSGAYISIKHEDLTDAVIEIEKARDHIKAEIPRVKIDGRQV
ncbi:hypothetical protein NVP1191O_69 [Vibrio phage 1.191.O._10N.286.52.B4]|nr:hypothetical protein NVP1191O_69 [Vibrio phage 1.191.O._10N.286.52.B4]